MLEICLECCPQAIFIPAHIWTPHFSLFGSQSGFDTLEECFEDLSEHIFALETGLSSDPAMNFRLSALDRYTLVSNSDAHSPKNLAREANLFDTELSYPAMRQALKTKDLHKFSGTIEFYPEEGKYHYDGHRNCQVCWSPEETMAAGKVCPRCGRKVTVGVMHRVAELADRPHGVRPDVPTPAYESIVPLPQILAELYQTGESSKKVQQAYFQLLTSLGTELEILRTIPLEDIQAQSDVLLAEGIRRVRTGEVKIRPGFDGEYGKVQLFDDQDRQKFKAQMSLFGIRDIPSGKGRGGEKNTAPLYQTHPVSPATGTPCLKGEEMKRAFGKEEKNDEAQSSAKGTQSLSQGCPPPWILQLNAEQRLCVTADSGPIVIIAGPGTGKTRTLVCRIAHLIQFRKIPAEQILAITFTNKAARELTARIRQILPPEITADALVTGTFHQLCLSILQEESGSGAQPGKTLINEQDALLLVRDALAGQSSCSGRRRLQPQRMYQWISRIKSRSWGLDFPPEESSSSQMAAQPPPPPWMQEAMADLSAASTQPDLSADELWSFCLAYQNLLHRYHVCDYDDLLLRVVRLFQSDPKILHRYRSRFSQVLVDEFQDVNEIQYLLVKLLAGEDGAGLLVIGDPDQAIYAFRGADYRFFFRLQQDFPGHRLFHLTGNYRSQGYILQAAGALIRHNSDRFGLELKPARQEEGGAPRRGIRLHSVGSEQAEGISIVREISRMMGGVDMLQAHGQGQGRNFRQEHQGAIHPAQECGELGFSDFAVLFRTGRQAGPLELCFLQAGIPYRVVGQKGFLQNPAVQTIVAMLRFLVNPEDDFSLKNLLHRREGEPFAGSLAGECLQKIASQRQCSLFQAIRHGLARDGQDILSQGGREIFRRILSLWDTYHLRIQERADQLVLDLIRQEMPSAKTGTKASEQSDEDPAEDLMGDPVGDMDRLYQCSKQFASIPEFLKGLLLFRDGDLEYQGGKNAARGDAVSLMTIHAAKGLEFPAVFICGLEEGLLPYGVISDQWSVVSEKQGQTPQGNLQREEERRLFYVALTRAKDELVLLSARRRQRYHQVVPTRPSSFLAEIPAHLMIRVSTASAAKSRQLRLF
ncbi:MAG: UvrD-helicase domain-containing protein [bacterium]